MRQGEVTGFIDIDIDFLLRARQVGPDAWGTSQPHNAYHETHPKGKKVLSDRTRRQAGLLTKHSIYHSSFLVSPTDIESNDPVMVTLDALKNEIGHKWQPTCAVLNAVEEQSKRTWGGTACKVRRFVRFIIGDTLTPEHHYRSRQTP